MIPTSISARVVGIATALLLLVSALAAPPALANAGCNNGDFAGKADLGLTQSVSALANGDYLDHLIVTNYGPCSVPNVGLTVALPGPLVTYSSNPSSWTCKPPSGSANVACWETSTIGVPGNADIYLEYTPPADPANGLITACAATFNGTPPPSSCDPAGGPVQDQNPSNNTSLVAAGVLTAGGTLVYGVGGNATPGGSNFDHTTSVALAKGGLVNIYQTDVTTCPVLPAGSPPCFLGTNTVNFGVDVACPTCNATWTVSFLASLTAKSLSQITIWNSAPSVNGGKFYPLTSCKDKTPSDPCVQDRSRSGTGANTVFTIVFGGSVDDSFTFD